jgi:hypothetical protein
VHVHQTFDAGIQGFLDSKGLQLSPLGKSKSYTFTYCGVMICDWMRVKTRVANV